MGSIVYKRSIQSFASHKATPSWSPNLQPFHNFSPTHPRIPSILLTDVRGRARNPEFTASLRIFIKF